MEEGRKRLGSLGILDMWKKKRELKAEGKEGIGQIRMEKEANKSKKTPRSPEKEGDRLRMMGIVKK